MVVLDVSIVNVALPSINKALHFAPGNLQWVITAYTLTFGGFLLFGGRAADLYGRRRIFIGSVTAFAVMSLLCGLKTIYTVETVDAELIKSRIPDYKDSVFYVSGPYGLVKAVKLSLISLDVPARNIITDYFPGYS